MSELALYRKYRSATFDEVVGQSHIVETLRSTVKSGKLSHAYLFTGPKGTGKTTLARLLARSANCTGETKPCGKCANCSAAIGSSLDLIEIDAASNRGIDDARALREKISLAPAQGKYKVYIIDEAHMLTTEAFNALLKTLEEPPPHAIFILATTEVHKLPETIISRTQRFTFKPIPKPDLVKHLSHIAQTEGIKISEDALQLIASASHGGFRDAISLLDQVSGLEQQGIEAADIRRLLGWTEIELIDRLIEAMINREAELALKQLDACLNQGASGARLTEQLIGRLQSLVRSEVGSENPGRLMALLSCLEGLLAIIKSPMPDLALEAAIIKLSLDTNQSMNVTPTAVSPAPAIKQTASAPAPTPAMKAPKPDEPTVQNTADQPNQELWLKALSQIKQHNNSLYALLRSSCTVHFEDDQVILGCRFGFHRDRIRESKNLQVIEQALARTYGRRLKAVPQLEASPPAQDSNDELVASALEILGGEVVE